MSDRSRQRLRTITIILATALVIAPAAALAGHQFTDVPASNIFQADIDWMADNGVTKGCNPQKGNTKYCPDDFVTRAQMAAFMHRLDTENVFLRPGEKAADADMLDGKDSAAFLSSAPGAVGPTNLATPTAARITGGSFISSGGTNKALSFDTVDFDTAALFDGSTPTRLTAPIDGIYQIQAGTRWSSNSTGFRMLSISSSSQGHVAVEQQAADGSGGDGQNVAATLSLSAGEHVEARVYQNSGSTLTTDASYTFLELIWIGPNG